MTEVTPDLIAEIATRLLNDLPQASLDVCHPLRLNAMCLQFCRHL